MNLTNFLLKILVIFLVTAIATLIFKVLSYSVYVQILFTPLQKSINKVKSKLVYKYGILVIGIVMISIFNAIFNYDDTTYGSLIGIITALWGTVLSDKKKFEKVKEE